MRRTAMAIAAIALLVTGVFVAPTIGTTQTTTMVAADADTPADTGAKSKLPDIKGSDKKGKFYYKKSCKTCHDKKGEGGELTPMSKTIKQWERYFKKAKHGEKTLFDEFDGEQLLHIKTFLINHAADSDQPETCG